LLPSYTLPVAHHILSALSITEPIILGFGKQPSTFKVKLGVCVRHRISQNIMHTTLPQAGQTIDSPSSFITSSHSPQRLLGLMDCRLWVEARVALPVVERDCKTGYKLPRAGFVEYRWLTLEATCRLSLTM
jgi:hypothetical protein